MQIGLCVSGTVFSMGLHPVAGRSPITPRQLMDQALTAGLQGVEIPERLLLHEDLAALNRYAQERGLFVTLSTGGFDPDTLATAITLGSQLDVSTIRTLVGGAKLGGDRRPLAGRWQPFLREVQEKLRTAAAFAEQAGITIAVENHQDLTSEELIWLCESIGSPAISITFDTGNPLATAEEPVDFAKRTAPYIRNVHLKDYWIYLSEEGYRLVRCPLGQGVIDFPALFHILMNQNQPITMSIELAALEARHIRVLADDYWSDYPPRTAAQLAQVLRMVYANAKPPGDWRTPYERNEPAEVIVAYEQHQLASSLAYIRSLQTVLF
jgi:sugar phosphate isomerase/epimerase